MKKWRLLNTFAHRYLFSRKSHSVVNIISIVSALSLSVPVAAMIIILSIQNGLNDFIFSLNSSFEPEIKVMPVEGRYFDPAALSGLSSVEGVKALAPVIENDVLLESRGNYEFLKVRGAGPDIFSVIPIEKTIYYGKWDGTHGALMGNTTAYNLSGGGLVKDIKLHVPQPAAQASFIPVPLYRSSNAEVTGLFQVDVETELKYLLLPIGDARRLSDKEDVVTAIFVKSTGDIGRTQQNIERWLANNNNNNFSVITQKQEKQAQYEILQQEKYVVFLLLIMVMIIASFTLIGAVTMLVGEKEKESSTLAVIGLRDADIRHIFIRQGMILAFYGIGLGTAIGLGLCFTQQYFNIIKMSGAGLLIESYPVSVSASDTLMIVATVLVLSFLIINFTVRSVYGRKKDN